MTIFEIIFLICIIGLFIYILFSHRRILKKEKSLDKYISMFITNNIDQILQNEDLINIVRIQSVKSIKKLTIRIEGLEEENRVYNAQINGLNNKMNELYDIIKSLTDEKIKLKQENKKLQSY